MDTLGKLVPWRSWIPTGLALGMLAVVVGAALLPNAGVVAAQATCQYSNCSNTSTTPSFPWLDVGIIGAVVAAGLVAALLLLRRRGGGAPESQGPPEPWNPPSADEPAPEASGAAEAPPPAEEAPPAEAYDESAPPPPETGGGGGSEDDINSLMNELEKMSGK